MNVWQIILDTLGWFLLVFIIVIAIVVVCAILVGLVAGLRKSAALKRERTTPYPDNLPNPSSSQDDYMAEGTVVALSMYGQPVTREDHQRLEAFRDGARWGWGFFHRP